MLYLDRAIKLLRDVDREMRSIMGQALAVGAYGELGRIAPLAEGVTGLLAQFAGPSVGSGVPDQGASTSGPVAEPQLGTVKKRPKAAPYPRFEREPDRLVKIGWSKRDKKEYEHRASQEVVELVADALIARADGKLFTMDSVLPLKTADGNEVPSYQAYLVLGWLRSGGAIQRRGRDGYVINAGGLDGSVVDALWSALPTR
jgi:hypothetical protein